ncbi:cobalamin-dependent protein [Aquibacillus koreensis]|uniref:Cobalamin-dependent protein n=1 Tax=Aquibacillus koreensis TaxID=279446 RepID=A0A9X3WQ06_9BACI|nr:cobalamin-dependent protein [Aquibacillus koreensis]MCT2536659.1 cobalamin-dependent protein [Aquibacillus koreensis]MDC3422613.1 cobalamin-dependent protein [Aquibacillus koreensis]
MIDDDLKCFVRYLLDADEQKAWEFLYSYIIDGKDSLYIFEQVLTPALRYIGYLWEENAISVADEHIASSICHFLMTKYSVVSETGKTNVAKDKPKAMFTCVEGEEHALGLKMVAALFDEYGWDTRLMGSNTPTTDIIAFANRWRPDIICLSLSTVYSIPHLIQTIKALEKLSFNPQIIIGGRVISIYTLDEFISENLKIFKDLTSLNEWLRTNKEHQNKYVTN